MNIAVRTSDSPGFGAGGETLFPDSFWRSLKQLNAFRFFLAAFFVGSALFSDSLHLLSPDYDAMLFFVAVLYLAAAIGFRFFLSSQQLLFSHQLVMQLVTDVVVISLFLHFGGGNATGLGLVMTVPMAAAGLHPQTRITLLLAALASLAVLLEQVLFALVHGDLLTGDLTGGYVRAAMLSVGFFTVATISHLLAKGALTSAQVADEKVRAANEMERINAKVIQDLPYGVLVLGPEGQVVLRNQKAEALLRCQVRLQTELSACDRELGRLWWAWQHSRESTPAVLSSGTPPRRLRVRLLELGPDRSQGGLVIVEDMSELEQEAMDMKLAAVGRLTANLAHEIRNPLSAINHASQLLSEDTGPDMPNARLTRIIEDNVARLNYLVEDVLSLSRRDRQNRELIDLGEFLPDFVVQFRQSEPVPEGVICLECQPGLKIEFDRMHLHQILWNVLRNARRHSSGRPCAIRLSTEVRGDMAQVEIYNDGPVIPPDIRQKLFEPFFSTERTGTGLGLYIAQELAEANDGQLRCIEENQGARFRLNAKLHD